MVSALTLPESGTVSTLSARRWLTPWQTWGSILIVPYIIIFILFVIYPVAYGFWIARHPHSYVELFDDPIFLRSAVNTLVFLVIGINIKMVIALLLSGFFIQARTWIKWLSILFILPWAVPSIPTILSLRFMLNPEWGVINTLIFRITGEDGPNWLNDPTIALSMAIAVHIWKSLPFWTLILIAGRLAIPHDLYEAASVDGATQLQKFKYVTWPSLRTLGKLRCCWRKRHLGSSIQVRSRGKKIQTARKAAISSVTASTMRLTATEPPVIGMRLRPGRASGHTSPADGAGRRRACLTRAAWRSRVRPASTPLRRRRGWDALP